MLKSKVLERELVLVGGGHAHVEVLRRFALQRPPRTRVTLVARDVLTPYSGMLPGYLAGHYTLDECHIDLAPLARQADARLLHASVVGLEANTRRLRIDGRPDLHFDLLSLDTGSTPDRSAIEGADRHAIAVKPVDEFVERFAEVEQAVLRAETPHRMLVVGGGAGGVEVCLGLHYRLQRLLRKHGKPPERIEVTLVTASETLLPQHAESVRARFERVLARRGITVLCGHRVQRVNAEAAHCEPYRVLPADSCLLFTDAAAPAWLRDSGLELDAHGFVRIDDRLRSLSHPQVFAAGDVSAFAPRPLLKNGVYAVRQGPLLAANLRAALAGTRGQPFRPQSRTLALISTGDRNAVASWAGYSLQGRLLWHVKDRIDRRFMRRYRRLPPIAGEHDMRCGGCGAKTAPAVQAAALAALRGTTPAVEGVPVGLAEADDGAVFEPPRGRLLVQSVDHFRSFIDDPWLFGRITAVHALGDLYAMGAEAHSALAMVTLPLASESMQADDLRALLEGVRATLTEAGAALLGGHTAEGVELALGLAVTGHVAPGAQFRRDALVTGDRLVLCKPLGSGVLMAAHMRARCPHRLLAAALADMQHSNRDAVAVLRAHDVHACTDVSGFGLLGHLAELLAASQAHALIDTRSLPLLEGARTFVEAGIESTLAPANRGFCSNLLDARDAGADALLFDPQTAGGLLAGVPRARAEVCVAALHAAGYAHARVIGEIVDGRPGGVSLLPAR